MTTALKPATRPRWATSGLISTPSSGAQDSGHIAHTALAAQLLNWFWNLVYQWIAYFDDLTQPALNAILRPSAKIVWGADDLQAVAIRAADGRLVGVGQGGLIRSSDDGGTTWTTRAAGSHSGGGAYAGDFTDVLHDVTTGFWIAAGAASIQISSTGISSWTEHEVPLSAVSSMVRVGTNRIVAATVGGQIYVTTDGGVTWAHSSPINGGTWSTLQMVGNSSMLLAIGRPVAISSPDRTKAAAWSSDGGVTWNMIDLSALIGASDFLMSATVAPDGTSLVAFVNTGGKILRSINGGAAWTAPVSTTNITSAVLSEYAPVLVVLPTAGSGKGYASRDSGASWSAIQVQGWPNTTHRLQYLKMFDASHMWIGMALDGSTDTTKYVFSAWGEF